MIYCIEKEKYPSRDLLIEELTYKDENDFDWKIGRTETDIYIKYCGHEYFKFDRFSCEIPVPLNFPKYITVKNTGCLIFKDASFETFYEIRKIISNRYTDDIWDCFEELLTERFLHDETLIESEKI